MSEKGPSAASPESDIAVLPDAGRRVGRTPPALSIQSGPHRTAIAAELPLMVTASDGVMLLIAWLSFRRDPPPSAPLIRFAVDSARIVEVS
jgi:hypothetical protein